MDHFEDLIQARQVREKGKPRKISDDRWLDTKVANALLDHHSVEELKTTLTWLFTHRLGLLPFPVVNEYTGRIDQPRSVGSPDWPRSWITTRSFAM